MSSKYTTMIPLAIRVLKMSFIIVWKVAGIRGYLTMSIIE